MRWINVLLLACFVFSGTVFAAEDMWDQKLPFEQATITYSVDGMEKGTEVLYIKNYGRHTAKHRTTAMSVMGMSVETNTLELMDPDWVYTYDLNEKTGFKVVNPKKYMKQEYDLLSGAEKKQVMQNAEQLSVNFLAGGGGKIEKNVSEMLGFKVDRATVMGFESYMIHDTQVPLKTSGSIMGMQFSMTATDFAKGDVSDSAFEHPAGIAAVENPEADAMARTMAQKTMMWLKDPDAARKAPPMPSATGIMGTGQTRQPGSTDQESGHKDANEMTEKAIQDVLKSILGN